MGYQECFVLPQADQSAIEIIDLMRNQLNSSHNIECPGISTFSCPLNCTVYPDSEAYSVENAQELVLSIGNRSEQLRLFRELRLRWIYVEISSPVDGVTTTNVTQGQNLFQIDKQYSEVCEG